MAGATSACFCGLPIPSFSFRIDPRDQGKAEAFFAVADIIVECPKCRRTFVRPLKDGALCESLDEALTAGRNRS